jgi:hypothetical protein
MSNIFVTNNSDVKLKDGYAGIFYEFKPGTTVEIPVETAKHIFGYEENDINTLLGEIGLVKKF